MSRGSCGVPFQMSAYLSTVDPQAKFHTPADLKVGADLFRHFYLVLQLQCSIPCEAYESQHGTYHYDDTSR